MKKKLTALFLTTSLFTSCTGKAIEPVSHTPPERKKAPLQVWGVAPSWGRPFGGYKIYINGLGFEKDARAFIGTLPCLRTKVLSHNTIRCTAPEVQVAGDYLVSVINPDGTEAPAERCSEGDDICEANMVYFYYVKTVKERIAEMENQE